MFREKGKGHSLQGHALRDGLLACWFVVLLSGVSLSPAYAQIGVGVGLGKVKIGEPLTPGGIYRLPDLPVVNTGSVPGNYQVRATNVPPNWLSFSPQNFYLKPNQSQPVKVSLTLPLTVPDGDYLAYLEASPVQNPERGIAIGPAAATKLYFGVKSGTVLGAIRNRIITFILTRPEIHLFLAAFLLLQAFLIFRRNFTVSFKPKPRPKDGRA